MLSHLLELVQAGSDFETPSPTAAESSVSGLRARLSSSLDNGPTTPAAQAAAAELGAPYADGDLATTIEAPAIPGPDRRLSSVFYLGVNDRSAEAEGRAVAGATAAAGLAGIDLSAATRAGGRVELVDPDGESYEILADGEPLSATSAYLNDREEDSLRDGVLTIRTADGEDGEGGVYEVDLGSEEGVNELLALAGDEEMSDEQYLAFKAAFLGKFSLDEGYHDAMPKALREQMAILFLKSHELRRRGETAGLVLSGFGDGAGKLFDPASGEALTRSHLEAVMASCPGVIESLMLSASHSAGGEEAQHWARAAGAESVVGYPGAAPTAAQGSLEDVGAFVRALGQGSLASAVAAMSRAQLHERASAGPPASPLERVS